MIRHASESRAIGATVSFLALASLAASVATIGLDRGLDRDETTGETVVPSVPAVRFGRKASVPSVTIRDLVNGAKMDINIASQQDLEILPGIGPALASRIVDYRETNGAFESVDDLTRVRGIGPKTLNRARSLLVASPATPKPSR